MSAGSPTSDCPPVPAKLPSLEIIRAELQAQATGAMQRQAYRFARTRAALVRQVGGPADRLYVRELVQDALADTWTGDLQWDPSRCSLLDHVCGAIRRRTADDAERARRYQHQPIDGLLTEDDSPGRRELEAFLARVDTPTAAIDHAAIVADVIAELRLRADPADSAVSAILDAWASGTTSAIAVMRRQRLTATRYRAARGRIDRLVPELPDDLCDAVLKILRRAS